MYFLDETITFAEAKSDGFVQGTEKKSDRGGESFWNALKNKDYFGYKFLRQHPLYYQFYGNNRFFIADFYCGRLRLVVEIYGGVHEKQAGYDKIRTEILGRQKDLRVLRFSNNEVLSNTDQVLNKLKLFVAK
jgi:very-short-patch-repair endonuclease